MSLKRKIALFLVNKIFVGTRKKSFSKKRKLLIWCGYKIGEGTKIVGPVSITGKLEVGQNCWIGKNFIVNGNGTVIIGNNVDIAPEVTFNTGGHLIGLHGHRAGEGKNYTQIIGNGCWICANSTFVNQVEIGDGCVVAAGAVVTKSFNNDQLIGGVPAKMIRQLTEE